METWSRVQFGVVWHFGRTRSEKMHHVRTECQWNVYPAKL